MEKTTEEILILGTDNATYIIGVEDTPEGWQLSCSDPEEQAELRANSPVFGSRQEAIDYIVASWPEGVVLI